MSIVQAYNNQVFAPRWWSIFCNAFYFSRRGLHRGVKRHASKLSGTMLDFGCGIKPYRKLFTVEQYVGVDIAESGHDDTLKHADAYYDGKTIPFPDGHFDSVLCSEVLEHVFNIDQILGELHRVTKPGATMLLTIPFAWDQHEVPYDFGRYTEWGIRYLLEQHGFEVVTHEKSATYIETVSQLFVAYFYKHMPDNMATKLLRLAIIAPVFLLSTLASKLLPDNGHYYLNHIILAQRAYEEPPVLDRTHEHAASIAGQFVFGLNPRRRVGIARCC